MVMKIQLGSTCKTEVAVRVRVMCQKCIVSMGTGFCRQFVGSQNYKRRWRVTMCILVMEREIGFQCLRLWGILTQDANINKHTSCLQNLDLRYMLILCVKTSYLMVVVVDEIAS